MLTVPHTLTGYQSYKLTSVVFSLHIKYICPFYCTVNDKSSLPSCAAQSSLNFRFMNARQWTQVQGISCILSAVPQMSTGGHLTLHTPSPLSHPHIISLILLTVPCTYVHCFTFTNLNLRDDRVTGSD